MKRPCGLGVLCAALLFALTAPALAKSYKASRFDVQLVVQPGGNLDITETFDFAFEGGPFTQVFREIPREESDGLKDFRGFLDGQELPAGAGEKPGLAIFDNPDSVTLVWYLPPTSNTSHSFTLKYRAIGAVRREEGMDLLIWKAVPPRHDYRIDSSTVTVRYPEGARLAGQPSAHRATVTTSGAELVFMARELGKDRGLTVRAPFTQGSLLSAPPLWQRRAQQRSAEVSSAIKLGFLLGIPLLLLGILLIVKLRMGQNVPRLPAVALTTPPDDLPPALVGAVRGGWSDWRTALAALIRLADRGFIQIVAEPKEWWATRDFTLRRTGAGGDLSPTERVLLQLIFGNDQPYSGEIRLRKAQRQLQRRWRQFTRALRQEAEERNLIDAERDRARRRWIMGGGMILLLIAPVALVTVLLFVTQRQLTHLATGVSIALALFLLGLVTIVVGASITRLNTAALRQKQNWTTFGKHLKALTTPDRRLQPQWLESYLPYAIALGLGNQWAKAFKDQGLPVHLAWLAGTENFDGSEIVALLSVLNATGVGHSSPGGAGGGAGGGGGASGAR